MLAHPSCINVIAQSMSTENIKTKIQGRSIKPICMNSYLGLKLLTVSSLNLDKSSKLCVMKC